MKDQSFYSVGFESVNRKVAMASTFYGVTLLSIVTKTALTYFLIMALM